MGLRKKPLAICDTSGMNGLANYMDEEEISTLKKTAEEQMKKLAEVEHILQKFLEGTTQMEWDGMGAGKIICGEGKRDDAGKKQDHLGETASYTKEGWA